MLYIGDTDSLKLEKGYNEDVIKEYNKKVLCKLKNLSEIFEIPYEKFAPKDKDGIAHPLGVFELDEKYEAFITQGAKKYAFTKWKKLNKVKDFENVVKVEDDRALVLGITVSGVPKKGAKALKKLEDFKDDFIFRHDDTGKNLLIYNDEQEDFDMTDFQGNTVLVTDRFGSCILPTTYELGKSQDYADLINENSAKISRFMEGS